MPGFTVEDRDDGGVDVPYSDEKKPVHRPR
jgi:hypothetical protein